MCEAGIFYSSAIGVLVCVEVVESVVVAVCAGVVLSRGWVESVGPGVRSSELGAVRPVFNAESIV